MKGTLQRFTEVNGVDRKDGSVSPMSIVSDLHVCGGEGTIISRPIIKTDPCVRSLFCFGR